MLKNEGGSNRERGRRKEGKYYKLQKKVIIL